MKYPIKLILLMLPLNGILTLSQAQPDSSDGHTPLSTLKAVVLQLSDPDMSTASVYAGLFNHFEVLDERPDTTRIGIHANRILHSDAYNTQLVFQEPVSREIGSFLNTRFSHPEAPYKALIVIRTLWLSDANNILEEMEKDPEKQTEKTKIRLKAEIYAEKDGFYTPVFRFDSLQVSPKKSSYTRFSRDLTEMLEEMADSASFSLAAKGQQEGRKITRAEILQFNKSRFDAPVCRDSLVQGVYMSFEEFKNNAPSVKEYEIVEEKGILLLYVKGADGQACYSHNAWGAYDGVGVCIMKDGVLVPAWKEEKAWYLLSQTAIHGSSRREKKPDGAFPILTSGVSRLWMRDNLMNGIQQQRKSRVSKKHVFTVDMDTGKLY